MKKKRPFSFVVGQGSVIAGWEAGIPTMSLGERALFRVQADLAYGEKAVQATCVERMLWTTMGQSHGEVHGKRPCEKDENKTRTFTGNDRFTFSFLRCWGAPLEQEGEKPQWFASVACGSANIAAGSDLVFDIVLLAVGKQYAHRSLW
eukprot:GGOE01003906.1.p4 GENE.GGOE01003906.1~~GGOE01003906.1.p4  ORF type:complete len:148 (+),score=19.74 GGOE01003906.1:340-783(+)